MHYDPHYPPPPPLMTDKERRIAMWVTIGTGALAVLSQVMTAGSVRRNSKAYSRNSKTYAKRNRMK